MCTDCAQLSIEFGAGTVFVNSYFSLCVYIQNSACLNHSLFLQARDRLNCAACDDLFIQQQLLDHTVVRHANSDMSSLACI